MKELQTIFSSPLKAIDPAALVEQALEAKQLRILNLNRSQLDRGEDAKGKSLGQYKNFKYKNRFKPVDLKLTGEFHRKLTLSRSKGNRKQAEIFSQDEKAPALEKKYGKDIMGLTEESTERAAEIIKPELQRLFKEQLVK